MATLNMDFLLGRNREVVDAFKRRRGSTVDIGCLQEVRYRGQGTKVYMEVRKSTSFGGADQRRAEME